MTGAARSGDDSYLRPLLQRHFVFVGLLAADGTVLKVDATTLASPRAVAEEILGRPLDRLAWWSWSDAERKRLCEALAAAAAGEPISYDGQLRAADGDLRNVIVTVLPLSPRHGRTAGVLAAIVDVTVWKEREAMLHRQIAGKDLLIRETDHRVKNALQRVASLLDLQARQVTDDAARAHLQDAGNRIRAIGAVHAHLQRATTLGVVQIGPFLEDLVAALQRWANGVPIAVNVDDGPFAADRASSLGLVINELLANAVAHAYPSDAGAVRIGFKRRGGGWRLTVEDDGVGLPADFDLNQPDRLGMRLVVGLAAQLGGTVSAERTSPGTRFRVDLPAVADGIG